MRNLISPALIFYSFMLFVSVSQAQTHGNLRVNGTPGDYQVFRDVKAVRCDIASRKCDNAIFIPLNQTVSVPVGTYLLGFENSIYPGVYTVDKNSEPIELQKLYVPSNTSGKAVRIYRDMNSLVEQRKIYLTMFLMKRHFFRLEKETLGDLYIATDWTREFVQRFNHSYCSSVRYKDAKGNRTYLPSQSVTACAGWNSGNKSEDLKSLYKFNSDGTFFEMLVTSPGITSEIKHPRYLVSLPLKEGFVSVFPGAYVIKADGSSAVSKQRVGIDSHIENSVGISLSSEQSFNSLNESEVGSCYGAKVWETEHRAYCTEETKDEEGCDRASARICSAMDISK